MSLAERAQNFASFSHLPYAYLSQQPHEFARSTNEGMNGLHFLWLLPANALSNLAGILAAPVFAIVNLIASAIFKMAALLSSDEGIRAAWNEAARQNFTQAVKGCTVEIGEMFLRIFNPNYIGCSQAAQEEVVEEEQAPPVDQRPSVEVTSTYDPDMLLMSIHPRSMHV